jgi:hypothetical protein
MCPPLRMLLLPALAAACASAPPPRAWRCGGRGRPALLASGRLRLRGGRGEEGAAGFRGEVALPAGSRSLPHIVQHASGPLRIRCTGDCSWEEDVAAIHSPHRVEFVGGVVTGASDSEQTRSSDNGGARTICAGQWFLMDDSCGSFKDMSLVFRCLVDRRNIQNRVDMMVTIYACLSASMFTLESHGRVRLGVIDCIWRGVGGEPCGSVCSNVPPVVLSARPINILTPP